MGGLPVWWGCAISDPGEAIFSRQPRASISVAGHDYEPMLFELSECRADSSGSATQQLSRLPMGKRDPTVVMPIEPPHEEQEQLAGLQRHCTIGGAIHDSVRQSRPLPACPRLVRG